VNHSHNHIKKEKRMTRWARRRWLGSLIVLSLAPGARAAEPAESARPVSAPLGHRDFYPSPEHPVGQRGDGSGFYPGATPVASFWEASFQEVDNPAPESKKADLHWPKKVFAFTDELPSHNLVWKARLPGWGYSQPLVVGDRVFACAEPHFLLCFDAHTGELLWQRELLPLLGSDLPEERVRQVQELLEIARAADHLLTVVDDKPKAPPETDAVIARFKEWQERARAIDPDAGIQKAFDGILDKLAQVKAGEKVRFGSFPRGNGALDHAASRKFGVPIQVTWFGYVGYNMTTPASDGQHVYAAFGQGQVGCYDLDGNLKWFRLLPGQGAWGQLRLAGGVLMTDVGKTLFGLDTAAGKTVWQVKDAGGGYKNAGVFYPKTPDGAVVPVVIPAGGQIIRVRDGKVVGKLDYWPAGPAELTTIGTANFVCANRSWNVHKGAEIVYRLEATSADEVRSVRLHELGDGGERAKKSEAAAGYNNGSTSEGLQSFAHGFLWSDGAAFDPRTGRAVVGPGREYPGGRNPTAFGARLALAYYTTPGHYGGFHNSRADGKISPGSMRVWDLRFPAFPIPLTKDNLLGTEELCRDLYLEKHLKGFDRWLFAGCYHGWPIYFGCTYQGASLAGNRAFIQSHSFVYCVGDPAEACECVPTQPERRAAAAAGVPALLAQAKEGATRRARLAALDALGARGAAAAFAEVQGLTADRDRLIRQRAAGLLPRCGNSAKDLVPHLTKDLAGSDKAKAEVAALVLRGLGAKAADQAPALVDLALTSGPKAHWASVALSGMGEAAVNALAPRLAAVNEPDTVLRTLHVMNQVAGADAAKARQYLAALRLRETLKKPNVHMNSVSLSPRDPLPVWPTVANRFLLAAAAAPEVLPEYRAWLETLLAAKDPRKGVTWSPRDLLPLLLIAPEKHREWALKALASAMRANVTGEALAVARGLGADAAPLLSVLQEAKSGKVQMDRWAPAWMVDSALERIGGPAAATDKEMKR
jgi:hypothetical protein